MRALAFHRFLLRFSFAGARIFAWIFIFQYFYLVGPDSTHAFARTALLFALSQTIICIITPYAAQILRTGTRKALSLACLLASGAFVILGAAFSGFWGTANMSLAIATFAIALGLYQALYWVPYEVESVAERRSGRGKGWMFVELLIALAPAMSGIFIAASGMATILLLYIGAATILLSVVPLLYVRDIYEGFSWGYRETFVQLLEAGNRPIVLRAFLEGISGAALLFFWPLAVYLLVGWSYGMLGIILSLTFVVAILLRSVVRKFLRSMQLQGSTLLNLIFAVTPWLFRVVVATPLGIILVDSYFYTTTPRRFGVDPFAFEQVSDGGSYVDEYTALKEISLSFGRIAACVVGAAIALLISLPAAFIGVFLVAACASATMALQRR